MTDPRVPTDVPDDISERALRSLPFSLVLSDPRQEDCPIVYVNGAFTETTGYAASAVVGRNCRFLQGKNTDEDTRATIRKALEEERKLTVDIVNYRADGSEFINRLMLSPIHDDEGELTYFLGIQSEKDAYWAQADRTLELGERLDELQHRIKNHLNLLISMIRLEARSGNPVKSLKVLARRVETLSVLYSEFAQFDSADFNADVALGAYVSRICAVTQDLIGSTRIRVNTQVCEANMNTDDGARLGLFLSEVLNNALEHAFPDDRRGAIDVRMDCQKDTGHLHLSVRDNGVGMAEGSWPKTDSLGGRIVSNLVRRLNGDLTVKSDEGGTCVELVIPFENFG